jgi:hypothetical protein
MSSFQIFSVIKSEIPTSGNNGMVALNYCVYLVAFSFQKICSKTGLLSPDRRTVFRPKSDFVLVPAAQSLFFIKFFHFASDMWYNYLSNLGFRRLAGMHFFWKSGFLAVLGLFIDINSQFV